MIPNSHNSDAVNDIYEKIKQYQQQKQQQQQQKQQNGYEIRDPHNILELLRLQCWDWTRSRL